MNLGRIQHHQVERRLPELQQRVAFQNQIAGPAIRSRARFQQRNAQQRHPFGEKALLRPEPKGSLSPRRQKSGTVGSRARLCLPTDCANVLVRRAIAVLSVLRADPMAILRDLSRDPVRLRKRGDQVAHQLRLADAPRVPADYNDPPALSVRHPYTVEAVTSAHLRRWPPHSLPAEFGF